MTKVQNFKLSVLTAGVAAIALLSAPAMANELINNNASGYVDGDIRQESFGSGESNVTAEVGSISADYAENNSAEGHVEGDVYQGIWYAHNVSLTTQVGSIKGKQLFDNKATGYVGGSIDQFVDSDFNERDIRVGSIDAGDSDAWGNRAEGYVAGSVYQGVPDGKASVRVGSIGPQ